MRLVVDENFPRPSAEFLRHQGHEVIEIAAVTPGLADIDVMRLAHESDAILVTLDRDHGELVYLHGAQTPLAIIYLRSLPPDAFAPAHLVATLLERDDLPGAMWVIDPRTVRRRPFPPTGAAQALSEK